MNVEYFSLPCQWQLQRVKRKELEARFQRFTGKIWVVELHIPYTRYDYWGQILDEARKYRGKKILVFNGDNLNQDIFSRFFRKETSEEVDDSDPLKELDTLLIMLKESSKIFNWIIFTRSNHDHRMEKIILENMPEKKVGEAILKRIISIKQWCEKLKINNVIHVPGIFFRIGDVLTCHFENNLSAPGSTARKISKAVITKMEPGINVIFQSHTHVQSRLIIMRKLIVETGALCEIQDYARGEKIFGSDERSVSIGYAHTEMVDGVADWNKTNFHICALEGYW